MKAIGPNAIDRLPLEPVTGKPLQPKAQPGYYPGYSTLVTNKVSGTRRPVRLC